MESYLKTLPFIYSNFYVADVCMTVPSGKLICPPTGFVILHFEVQWVYTVYRSLSRIMFPVPTIACSGSIHRFHRYSCLFIAWVNYENSRTSRQCSLFCEHCGNSVDVCVHVYVRACVSCSQWSFFLDHINNKERKCSRTIQIRFFLSLVEKMLT